jgi:hypothetical protein
MVKLNNLYFDGSNDTLRVHVILDFQLKADVPIAHIGLASCGFGEPLSQIELTLSSKLTLENDGNLSLSNKTWGLKWIKDCNLTAMDIKAEDLLNLPFVRSLMESKINDLVQNKIPNTFNYKSQLEKNWSKLSQPFKLKNIGYLDMRIQELSAKNLYITNDQISTNVGAICSPVINLSDDTLAPQTVPFPKLTVQNGNDSVNVNILASVSFKKLNDYAKLGLDKYMSKIGIHELEINGLNLYQHGDSVVIAVELTKPFRGKVYLWGKPYFDLQRNIIGLNNLEYTIDSKNLLVKYANELISSPIIEKKLETLFQFKYEKNLSDCINKVKTLEYQLASNIILKTSCNLVRPLSVVVSDNKLNFVVNIRGQAFLKMN